MRPKTYSMKYNLWDVETVDLTLEQEGAYLRLCHAMFAVGGPLPNSTRYLRGLFRCGDARASTLVQQLIDAGKISLRDDGMLTRCGPADRMVLPPARNVRGAETQKAPPGASRTGL